eukprot:TRINITY_DN7501_c0_g1_i5.p1 TRINITY_DN7501_c0_g1~~TRINITY_DN7501_c0_g1_i5.p1  ORF type:complete len:115 (+),score=27.64 TRINITY_DN7501_c0_g1_i5:82-426(+)
MEQAASVFCSVFFFNDTATTEIYTLHIVGSVRCVQETETEVSKPIFWVIFANGELSLRTIRKQVTGKVDYIFYIMKFKIDSTKSQYNSSLTDKPHVLCVDTCLLYTSPSPRDQA